jgi:hypothetical protein
MKSIALAVFMLVCLVSPSFAQDVPQFEISAGGTFLRDPSNQNRYGWIGSFSTNVNKWFAVKGEVGGYYTGFQDDNIHTFSAGPQFTLRRDGSRVQPWAHFLLGAQKDHEFQFPGVFVPKTRLSTTTGGGLDVSLNSRISLRFGGDWLRGYRDRFRDLNHYRLQTGVVFKLN